MNRIHKRVQVFLHSCNTTSIEEWSREIWREKRITEEGGKRLMDDLNAGVGGATST